MWNFTLPMLRFSLLVILISTATSLSASGDRKTYIIHMDKSAMPAPFSSHHDWYMSTLSALSLSDAVAPTHLYTYNHVMDGFSAVLSQPHLDQLQDLPGHLATYPETFGYLQTTHTPKFLGLKKHSGLWPAAGFGDDIIIGVLDSGIWPESESFNDDGMPPVPERWHGICEVGTEFNSSHCNKKLIGARSFSKGMKQYHVNISKTNDYDSPRDWLGHGSHTSSTAAGSRVQHADYFGYAEGTASGVAPMARIAMYKVIYFGVSNRAYRAAATDVLAGLDQAIVDGVDVLSLSLAFFETMFDENPVAVGTFAALKKGIFVACAAGNAGPHRYTMQNGAPWITAIGAGTIDRDFAAQITLGDEELTITGRSIYPENLLVSNVPIYFGHGNRSKETCTSIDPADVTGKYIFCDFDNKTSVLGQLSEMYETGAIGGIFRTDDGQTFQPKDFNIPFVTVNLKDGELVKKYIIKAENNATASITFQLTVLGTKPAPQVAFFSSRGPDIRSPWILKPDILAPGVDILAAWVPNRVSPAMREDDYLVTDYALLSGTSMATPHVAGIAALLKATHHDWSSAAIRSAMMTTAYQVDNVNGIIIDMTYGTPGTPLDYGAGHVNPNKAMDPGLVYDIVVEDYVNYLCGLNYTSKQIRVLTGSSNFTCEHANLDLNYPSFIVILNHTDTTSSTFKRVLTNVADNNSVYQAVVQAPTGMKVVVEPATITFAGKHSKAEFNLTVSINLGNKTSSEDDYFGNYGFLSWYEVNGKHIVRSPIVSAFDP